MAYKVLYFLSKYRISRAHKRHLRSIASNFLNLKLSSKVFSALGHKVQTHKTLRKDLV